MSALHTRWGDWLLLGFLAILPLPVWCADDSAPPVQVSVQQFERADFQSSASLLPPSTTDGWQPVTLPDNWNVSRPGQGGHGWYRFQFELGNIPATPQAIYFSRASMNATVFLNQALIDNSGGLWEGGVRNWNRPFLIQFLPNYLKPGANELLIRVDAKADDMGGLSEVALGEVSQLEPAYQQRRFIQLVIPQISEVFVALVCLVTAGLWLMLRERLYGYFALAAGSLFIRELDFSFSDFSIPVGWSQMGVATLVSWFVLFLLLFSVQLFQLHWPRIEKCLLCLAGLSGLALLVFGASPWTAPIALSMHVLVLVLGLVGLVVLIPQTRRVPYIESLPLTGAGLISFALGVHDVLQRLGLLSTAHPRLSHLGAPILILTMASILFSRYVKNIMLLEQTNHELEQLVKQKSAELVATVQIQHQMALNHAVLQERELIMREMHDGVGNYLTIALRAAARGVPDMPLLNSSLKSCMLDLRLMMDSLGSGDSGADSVATVLGNLRYRMEPALRAEGIQLVWEVEEVEIFTTLTPRHILNLTRIFQEALTNVIKHAKATKVVMRAESLVRQERRWAVLTLADDGLWCTPSDGSSYGQENMRRRALQLDGDLQVIRTPGGSSVELSLPEERRLAPRHDAMPPTRG